MSTNLKTITISLQGKGRVGDYAKSVIERGYIPGVLSGAELTGKAAQFAGGYRRQREKAAALVAPYGVRSGLIELNSRTVRVWVSAETGDPVRLTIAA